MSTKLDIYDKQIVSKIDLSMFLLVTIDNVNRLFTT